MTQLHSRSDSISIPIDSYTLEEGSSLLEVAWKILTTWDNWRSWVPTIDQLSQLDEGNSGRGSRLKIFSKGKSQLWTINFWDPCKRIEFIINSDKQKQAMAISLNDSQRPGILTVKLESEYIFRGIRRPLAPLLLVLKSRYNNALLQNFQQQLLSSSAVKQSPASRHHI